MRRRQVIAAVVGALAGGPVDLLAQQRSKVWRIGFLAHRYEKFYDPLFSGLKELGYVEGQNLNVEAVVVVTTPAAVAVKNETKTIPIIHTAAIDPVGTGLVASLAHPGGNVTGLAVLNAETSAKRVELLQEVVPSLSDGAVLWNSANPANALAWLETESAGLKLGVKLKSQEVRGPKDFEGAFAEIVEQRPDVLFVVQDALTLEFRKEIIDFTLHNKLPSMFVTKEWVEEGGLLSYGDRPPE